MFRFIKLFWLITCFDLSQFWEDILLEEKYIFIQKSSCEILFLFLTVPFSSENSEKTYQASLLTKLFIWYLWIILTSSCLIFEFVFISGFLLSDMAKRFLLGRTPFFSEVLGWRYYLTVEELDFYWLTKFIFCSNEYPLFIPRQNYCSTSGENSWSDRSSSNFGVASIESERKPRLDSSGSSSFNYSSASPHSVETHKDLQRGISLLKKSVACITAYCYNSLCLDVPSEASTFEAFAKLLSTLSSSKEVHSVFSLKMACSRYTVPQLLWGSCSVSSFHFYYT